MNITNVWCSPYSLTSAPRVFTKVLGPVLVLLRQRGIAIISYLDDMLLWVETPYKLKDNVEITMCTLQDFDNLFQRWSSLLSCMHALGIMVIIFGVVPYEQFHTRALQREIQMKWDKSSATLDNQINLGGSTSLSTMVASVSIPTGKEVQSPPLLDGRHNGCQPIWLGRGGPLIEISSESLDVEGGPASHQCPGTEGSQALFGAVDRPSL